MSVSVSRADGRTVLTLTSDQSSVCPPFCQLLGALCYSPGLCSKKNLLTPHRVGAQAALGALWIITALLHIGLGVILFTTRGAPVYILRDTYCPFWLGGLFLLLGVCSVFTEKHSRSIFILMSALLNLGGVALSIAALVWYSADIDYPGFWSFCRERHYHYEWDTPAPTSLSPEEGSLLDRCEEARDLLKGLTTSIRSVLVLLSALDLCVGLSSAIISFKTLKHGAKSNKPQQKDTKE